MIQPTALYNKCRFARDFVAIGRVVSVLCNNAHISREDLSDAELSMLEEIENENSEMDKRIEKEHEDTRKRQKKYRERHGMSRDITDDNGDDALSRPLTNILTTSLPSSLPTSLPSSSECVNARTRDEESVDGAGDERPLTVPTDEEMRQMARQIQIPTEYVDAFASDMRGLGWGYVNKGGVFVQLNRRNCKAVMRNFYSQHVKGGNKPSGRGVTVRGTGYVEGIAHGLGI